MDRPILQNVQSQRFIRKKGGLKKYVTDNYFIKLKRSSNLWAETRFASIIVLFIQFILMLV